jgi:hypothetical protein
MEGESLQAFLVLHADTLWRNRRLYIYVFGGFEIAFYF